MGEEPRRGPAPPARPALITLDGPAERFGKKKKEKTNTILCVCGVCVCGVCCVCVCVCVLSVWCVVCVVSEVCVASSAPALEVRR